MTQRYWKQTNRASFTGSLRSLSKGKHWYKNRFCDMRKGRFASGKFSAEIQRRLVFFTLNRSLFQTRRRSIQTHHFLIIFSPIHKILTKINMDTIFEKDISFSFTELFSQKLQAAVRRATDYGCISGMKYK